MLNTTLVPTKYKHKLKKVLLLKILFICELMNIQQLKVFREVMKSGSLNSAAKNLHRSQPAISASLKSLENSLDIVLFKREGRRLLPKPEAYYLLLSAESITIRLCRWQLTRGSIVGNSVTMCSGHRGVSATVHFCVSISY